MLVELESQVICLAARVHHLLGVFQGLVPVSILRFHVKFRMTAV